MIVLAELRPCACDLASAPSSRWSLTTESGAHWLKTPCGERFYSLGVNTLDGGYSWRTMGNKVAYNWPTYYPSLGDWVKRGDAPARRLGVQHRRRLVADPGQAAGADDRQSGARPARQVPLVRPVRPGDRDADDGHGARVRRALQGLALPHRLFLRQRGRLVGRRAVPLLPDDAGGQFHQAALGRRCCASITAATGAGSPPILSRRTASTRGTPCSPPRNSPGSAPAGPALPSVREWTGIVAERYYALAEKAIRAADPDALYFGDRLPIYYDPAAVKAMAGHVDAIATNYNPDAGDGWIAHYYWDGLDKLSGGKPVLVTEWFFAANQNRTGNTNNGHLMTVDTQAERARGAAAAVENFAAIPLRGRDALVSVLRPSERRPSGRRGLRFRPRRHRRCAIRGAYRRAGRRQSPGAGDPCRGERQAGARQRLRAAACEDRARRPYARRLAEAGEPVAAAEARAGHGRFRRNLHVVERQGPQPGDHRPGLFRRRLAGLWRIRFRSPNPTGSRSASTPGPGRAG